MNKIHLLEPGTIEKIAAGEMVERPVSVVKELLENAIDAGATGISVELQNGGLESICVSDNGSGMNEEDAKISILRHATSKIQTIQDLSSLRTLGFRGEALASISTVSLFSLLTAGEDKHATLIEIEGGILKNTSPAARPKGTTITIKALFYNIPARKKFLKSERSEMGKIAELVEEFAFCYPEIGFILWHDKKKLLDLPIAENKKNRLMAMWGNETVSQCLGVDGSADGISVTGFLGHPQISRNNSKGQYFFVNRRPITDRALAQTVRRAYGELIPSGRYPLFLLFMEIDPNRVDVNVHPTKREIRFADSTAVLNIIYSQVSKALRNSGFALADYQVKSGKEEVDFLFPKENISLQESLFSAQEERSDVPREAFSFSPPAELNETQEEMGARPQPLSSAVTYFQLHNLYILTQIKNGLLLIDQHAAHERILYEKALAELTQSSTVSQQLLFPIMMELKTAEKEVLESMLPYFSKLGFDIKPFGGNTFAIEGIPPALAMNSAEQTLRDMLSYLLDANELESKLHDRIAKSYACGAAIKAGQSLSQEEMNALMDALFLTQTPYTCPHGRPTLVRISIDDISKRFLR
jgi:DNA mismatch repair protein MutL